MTELKTDLEASRRFWNAKARENCYWYVSSCGPYEGRDLSEFWASGPRIWSDLMAAIGYVPSGEHTVVEIGCGVGRLTRAIAPQVGRVEAFDISEQMLAVACEHASTNVHFHHTDGASLTPLADGSAELVLAYCVFQHLPSHENLGTYLREMVRVAKPGGLVAFTMTPHTTIDWLMPVFRLRRWLKESIAGNKIPNGLYRREWVGIRLKESTIRQLSPIALSRTMLHGNKWLFYGHSI